MLGRWNEGSIEAESLINRGRYRRLDAFLARRGQVIRVAPDNVCGFLHGKAGVIERADGRKVGFIGSMNETRHGWRGRCQRRCAVTSAASATGKRSTCRRSTTSRRWRRRR
jgi:hypothetical protein